jgi:large subunit ribosomal protein L2
MPSGEIRNVDVRCRRHRRLRVGNAEQANINWGQGRPDALEGQAPTVRGVAMNPVDHPHGGGEGKTSGGRHPSTRAASRGPYPSSRKRPGDELIVRRRRKGGRSVDA